MAETQAPEAPQEAPQQEQAAAPAEAPKLLAGKYKDRAGLEQGIRELAKMVEYPQFPDGDLIGDGAPFADVETAEDAYRAFSRMRQRQARAANEPEQPQEPAPPQEQPAAPPQEQLGVTPAPDPNLDANAIAEQAGLDPIQIAQEFASNAAAPTGQKLAAEKYQAIQAVFPGATPRMIDDYLGAQMGAAAAQQLAQTNMVQGAIEIVGGEQQLATLRGWAAANIPAEELGDVNGTTPGTINHRLNDPVMYKGAIAELMGRHAAQVGAGNSAPLLGGGSPGSGTSSALIGSRKEYFDTVNLASRGNTEAQQKLMAHRRAGGSRFA